MRRDSKEFKALQSKWYKKLKREGYEDIEQADGNLKVWHSFRAPAEFGHVIFADAKLEYYRLAEHFLNSYQFPNPIEKKAWALHCEGVSIEDIAAVIGRSDSKNKSFGKTVNKRNVHETLQRLAKEMLNRCRTQNE